MKTIHVSRDPDFNDLWLWVLRSKGPDKYPIYGSLTSFKTRKQAIRDAMKCLEPDVGLVVEKE